MGKVEDKFFDVSLSPHRGIKGPVTKSKQRRTMLIYVSMVVIGLLPWIFNFGSSWQAAGLGLWAPGAGFLAVGGWWSVLFPVTLLLFIFSLIAWFWAGIVIAPVTVWIGAAILAGLLSGENISPYSPFITAACIVAFTVILSLTNRRNQTRGKKIAEDRLSYLPSEVMEISKMANKLPDPTKREMDADQLGGVRYLLDRSLQPIDKFDGFNIIDQFQPAALRYQINHMGYALAVAQSAYVPNFRGYFGLAQRNLIEKCLVPKVWRYWILESCWGNLNFTDWDPAAKDNIMLTGWFGMQVGGYMLSSGDRRYLEPGSLTFRLNNKFEWKHDFQSIIKSIGDNFHRSKFGIYACEPNWIYPVCNHYGMLALATYDALLGEDLVKTHLPSWLKGIDTEFTGASGSVIGLRSELTGLSVPFPISEAAYAWFENAFIPSRAQKLYAIGRHDLMEHVVEEEGVPRLDMPGAGVDPGNYGKGFTALYGGVLAAAREFGDDYLAEAALNGLERECHPNRDGGVLSYMSGSNQANANAFIGLLGKTNDIRQTFTIGTSSKMLAGPMIETMDYPNVLVARAWSDGEILEATFVPGGKHGTYHIPLSQLKPGKTYEVLGAVENKITADAEGQGRFSIALSDRLEVSIRPI